MKTTACTRGPCAPLTWATASTRPIPSAWRTGRAILFGWMKETVPGARRRAGRACSRCRGRSCRHGDGGAGARPAADGREPARGKANREAELHPALRGKPAQGPAQPLLRGPHRVRGRQLRPAAPGALQEPARRGEGGGPLRRHGRRVLRRHRALRRPRPHGRLRAGPRQDAPARLPGRLCAGGLSQRPRNADHAPLPGAGGRRRPAPLGGGWRARESAAGL